MALAEVLVVVEVIVVFGLTLARLAVSEELLGLQTERVGLFELTAWGWLQALGSGMECEWLGLFELVWEGS